MGMWLVGLPNPVLWGVMAACLNYLPYFGCIVGSCVVFLVGVISLDSMTHAAWAPTIYLMVNGIEGLGQTKERRRNCLQPHGNKTTTSGKTENF
jgi:predicted PurR-regulated permease PerM